MIEVILFWEIKGCHYFVVQIALMNFIKFCLLLNHKIMIVGYKIFSGSIFMFVLCNQSSSFLRSLSINPGRSTT